MSKSVLFLFLLHFPYLYLRLYQLCTRIIIPDDPVFLA